MEQTNKNVDEYLGNVKKWQVEMQELRRILLECAVEETIKWGVPCYTAHGGNVLILGSFKGYCALSFLKGVLLKDSQGILSLPGENSQSGRLVRFTTIEAIIELEPILKDYIQEAIEVEKMGLKVDLKKDDLVFTEELQKKLKEDLFFKIAFEALTQGRQRGYNLYFSSSKQSKTRLARIEKYTPRILSGKGINDCVCGISKKMPSCDGSHKYIGSS